jgi:lipoprotein-releasing system permease protein
MGQYVQISVGTYPPVSFKVVGRFYTGNRVSDLTSFGQLTDVQKLNHIPNQVNEIAVKIKDYTQAAAMAANWSKIAPERTESWDQQNENILSIFKIQNALRFSMIFTVILVAGFGIYNVLNMTVNQKRHDIAILRSMGYDKIDVIFLFFSQGIILGFVGGVLGLFAGYFICRYLQTLQFSGPIGTPGLLHVSLSPLIYIQALLLAIISSSVASTLPARAAGQLTPIEIFRSGE